jgi:predicted Zn-dependent peptidase
MIDVHQLKNGIRVVFDYIPQVETVSLGMFIGSGSRLETSENNGIAHVLEHMAFKGTNNKSAKEIAEVIEFTGGYMNAYTSKERTAYYFKMLSKDFNIALELLSDILNNSTFDETELAKEKGVILQELKNILDTPDNLVFDHYFKTAFAGQPVGMPIIGTEGNIKKFDRSYLLDFVNKYYKSDRMVLSFAGNFDQKAIINKLDSLFGNFTPDPGIQFTPASYTGGEFKQVRKLEQVQCVIGFKGLPFTVSEEYYALNIMNIILGGGMSSRLFQEIREKKGLAYAISAGNSSYLDDGTFLVYAGTAHETLNDLLASTIKELMLIANEPVNDTELKKAKNQVEASLLMAWESTSYRVDRNAKQILTYNRIIDADEIMAKINAVTKDDIIKVANKIFKTKPTIATLGKVNNQMSYNDLCDLLKL